MAVKLENWNATVATLGLLVALAACGALWYANVVGRDSGTTISIDEQSCGNVIVTGESVAANLDSNVVCD